MLVLPLTSPGKLPRGQPLLNGHSGAVMDTAWNPFNDNMLATGSDDATVSARAQLHPPPFRPPLTPHPTLLNHYPNARAPVLRARRSSCGPSLTAG